PVPLPKSPKDVPPETRAWLEPSAMMQSDDREIQALAAKIRVGATSVQELVQKTLDAMVDVRRPVTDMNAAVGGGLDALNFLHTGQGSCTSNADLFAALMRANGIPCRVYNVISAGLGQDMHFTNEYWVNGKGWVHVEPQGRDIQTPRTL